MERVWKSEKLARKKENLNFGRGYRTTWSSWPIRKNFFHDHCKSLASNESET